MEDINEKNIAEEEEDDEEKYLTKNISVYVDKDHLETLLDKMIEYKASGLIIKGDDYVWIRVNGRLHKITRKKLSNSDCNNMLNEAYRNSVASSTIQTGRPLDFAYQLNRSYDEFYRFRINAVSTMKNNAPSLTMTVRLIDSCPPQIEKYNVPKDIIETFMNSNDGIIYVAGATGSGKSTLLASLNRKKLEQKNSNIIFVEFAAPIEFVYDQLDISKSVVTQIEIGRNLESFSNGVENAMRMEPQIVQVSESRDLETISASLNLSTTGHLVTTTIHASSVSETFRRIIDFYPMSYRHSAQQDILSSAKMIIAQRLINTKDGKRTAIREYLVLTPEIKYELQESKNLARDVIKMVEKHGQTMSQDIKRVYNEGLITKEYYDALIKEYELDTRAIIKDTSRNGEENNE